MKNSFILAISIIAFTLTACEKKYTYVETVSEPSLLGGSYSDKEEAPVVIKAKNDTLAYLEACQKFAIAMKVYKDMGETVGNSTLGIPKKFALYNADGKDITDIAFVSREAEEAAIIERIFSMENKLEETKKSFEEERRASIKVDSAAVEQLLPFFTVKKDEFDPKATTWYTPRSAPKYINRNGIYCYFGTADGLPKVLRFVVQYRADNWLFIKKVQFSIDGSPYEFVPNNVERDNEGGYIWEWFDEPLLYSSKDIIRALSEAKSAKMKLIGDQYYDIKQSGRERRVCTGP